MGYKTEIFSSPPPEWAICSLCLDVFKDAVSMEGCGHTFCEECANDCLPSGNCPTCRGNVTKWNPNFSTRDSIESLHVYCSHRQRGRDGEIISEESCNWIGPLKDLETHEDDCNFKTISCPHDDCNHECCEKDMHVHLEFHRHKDSIKADYERQIEEMGIKVKEIMDTKETEMQQKINSTGQEIEQSIKASYERQMQEMRDKMNDAMEKKQNKMQQKIDLMEEDSKRQIQKMNDMMKAMEKKENEMQCKIDSMGENYKTQIQEMSNKMNETIDKKENEMQQKIYSIGKEIEQSIKAKYERQLQEMKDAMNESIEKKANEIRKTKITPNCPCCFNVGDVRVNMDKGYVAEPNIPCDEMSEMPIPSLARADKESQAKRRLTLTQYNACRRHCKFLFEVVTLVDFFPYKFGDVTPYMVERMSGLIVFILSFLPKHMDENALHLHRVWRKNKETFTEYLLNSSARFVDHLKKRQRRRWIKREDLYGSVRVNKYTVKPLFKLFYQHNPQVDKSELERVEEDHRDKQGNFMMLFKKVTGIGAQVERRDKRFKDANGIDALIERKDISAQQLTEQVYRYAEEIAKSLQDTIALFLEVNDKDFISYNTQMEFRQQVYQSITKAISGDDGTDFGNKSFKFTPDDQSKVERTKALIDHAAKTFAFTFQTRCKSLYQIGSKHQHDNCIVCKRILHYETEDVYFYFEVMECLKSHKKLFKDCILQYETEKSEMEKGLDFSELVCGDCVKSHGKEILSKLTRAQIARAQMGAPDSEVASTGSFPVSESDDHTAVDDDLSSSNTMIMKRKVCTLEEMQQKRIRMGGL